jgi:chromosome segregation ATPase
MWWKKFIGSPLGISSLPREKLHHLYAISSEQIQKMKSQDKALRSEIHDISVETTRQLFLLQQSTMNVMDPTSDEVCPANYSASERRCGQLRAKIAQILADTEQVDNEIAENANILAQYIELHQVEQPIPHESLLVGPFNCTDLRKIYTQLSIMAETAATDSDREDYLFCLDILSGESQLLARRMEEMKAQFEQDCLVKQEELDKALAEAQRADKAVRKLRDQMEFLAKKAEQLRPILPSVKKDLQNEVKTLGDTAGQLETLTREIERMRRRKEEYKEKLTTLGAQLLLRPLDDEERKSELDESIKIRQQKTLLDIELHELEQQRMRNESNLGYLKEWIAECERETAEMLQQSQKIREAADLQRWKFDKLNQAQITVNDLEFIQSCSTKMLPDELEKSSDQMREHIKLLEKRKATLKRRKVQLAEQEKQYEAQIQALEELFAAGKVSSE